MPIVRPHSFLDRLQNVGRYLMGGREQRSIPFPDQGWFGSYGRPPLFKPKESLQAYGDNVWLYAAVNIYADELARTPFRLQKRNAKGEVKYIEKHQALEVMDRPQPLKGGKTMLTKMILKKITGMHLMLNGEAFWALDRRLKPEMGRGPRRIDLLLPEFVRTVTDPTTGDLLKYVYQLPTQLIELPPEDVVHFRLPDPQAWERGHAPTQSIRYSLDTHKEADILNFKRLMNNAVPGGIITTEQMLNDAQIQGYRNQWRQLYGGSENANKVAVMPKGMDFKTVQQTNQEMQFVEGKGKNMEEILANFRVGPEMLGKTESQTRANAEAAIFVFMRFGVLSFLELFAEALTTDYLPAFPGTDGLEFGFPDPVPENMDEKRQNALTLWQMGALSPDEARKDFGREALGLPGMDVPYLDLNKIPIGETPLTGSNTNNLPVT